MLWSNPKIPKLFLGNCSQPKNLCSLPFLHPNRIPFLILLETLKFLTVTNLFQPENPSTIVPKPVKKLNKRLTTALFYVSHLSATQVVNMLFSLI